MKSNSVEVLLFPASNRHSIPEVYRQKFIMEWFTNKVLPLIVIQENATKKMLVRSLKNTPAIYLS